MNESQVADILTAVSEIGQGERCGPNFKFLPNLPPYAELSVTITGTQYPGSVKATLYRDKFGADEFVAHISNGSYLDASKIDTDDEYYIASPSGATGNFIVY